MMMPSMIRVMSFNIRYGTADDGVNHWEHRKPLVLARIRSFEPDLLGLQECRDDAQAGFVKSSLPDYYFCGVRRGGDGDGGMEMAPVLVRKAAFEVVASGHFWLSDTPAVEGSKSWGSTFARTATWVRLRHLPTGRSVTFANTHFDYVPAAIDGAARLLQNWLDDTQRTSPVIVTGDFNADKDSVAYQLLAGGGARFDAYRKAHPNANDEATFHGFGTAAVPKPIDWVIASKPFAVADAGVDRFRAGVLFPSDHDPVLAVLDWEDDSASAA